VKTVEKGLPCEISEYFIEQLKIRRIGSFDFLLAIEKYNCYQ
jgi:hypothetical protein